MRHLSTLAVGLIFLSACTQNPPAPPTRVQQPVDTIPQTPVAVAIVDTMPCPGEPLDNPTDTIPANLYSPKKRWDVCGWWMPEDTVTPAGNFIHYLISRDTCCLDYLYLEWGNKQFKRIENLGSLRQFHPKMNPEYVAESADYLFLEGAASGGIPVDGWMLWLFPLHPGKQYDTFVMLDPDACDLNSLTIVRQVDKKGSDDLYLEAYNIRTRRRKPIPLKHHPDRFSDPWLIDSISVTPQQIYLKIELPGEKSQFETVQIANDIKG